MPSLSVLMIVWAFASDGKLKDYTVFPEEYTSMQECLKFKPDNQITVDGTLIIFECQKKEFHASR
jgi:hypothetical protein